MSAMKVLIIEDQRDIAANIWDYLERRGYTVDHAADGMIGLALVMRGDFDAIVLDLGLPRLDGLDLCRRLRASGCETPILMLTARQTLEDKLKGFAEGADDYMVKPFELRELEVRLRALRRRALPAEKPDLSLGPLRFDAETLVAHREGNRIALTRTQARILELLMRRSPAVVSQKALIDCVWGARGGDAAALHTHLYSLRHLIDKAYAVPLIQTVYGIGYRMVAPDD